MRVRPVRETSHCSDLFKRAIDKNTCWPGMTVGGSKRTCQSSTCNELGRFSVLYHCVFGVQRAFVKSTQEMNGVRVVLTCWSVSTMMDPRRQDPAGDETTRD